jgi:thiol-disulfide isomerase/thioredoxin
MVSKSTALIYLLLVLLAQPLAAQQTAPPFSGVEVKSGETISLADYLGKVVFLDFWASWCVPCLSSLPAYEEMRKEIGTAEFELIAVNVDEFSEDGLAFLGEHPVSYPVLLDPDGEIGIPYQIRTLPHSFLIDRDGRIVASYRSFKKGDEARIKKEVEHLIAIGDQSTKRSD